MTVKKKTILEMIILQNRVIFQSRNSVYTLFTNGI